MSGLPPTSSQSHKVTSRSKTSSSFKRPLSCYIDKKEPKGLFHNLRKGSSNSKINEIEDDHKEAPAEIINEKNVPKRIEGRKFDSDEDDDDYISPNSDTSVTKMDKMFENIAMVVTNPALIGYLLRYLLDHNMDCNALLYYIVAKHYKSTVELKECKEANRFANEILTTFLLEKSVLKVDCKIDVLTILDNLKTNSNLLHLFDKSADDIYNHNIKESVSKIRQSITHGLFTVDGLIVSSSIDAKLIFFNDCIKYIVKSISNRFASDSDILLAVKTSLATIYYYFNKKNRDDNADNLSTISSRNFRNSFMGKSTESLQFLTNCVLEKQPIFCSKLSKKPPSTSFFKRAKSSKTHYFQESVFDYPKECLHCQRLLWGVNPQGWQCSHCNEAVHKSCKDSVSVTCIKEGKKNQHDSSNITPTLKGDTIKIGNDEDTVSIHSEMSYNNNNDVKDSQDQKLYINDTHEVSEDQVSEKSSVSMVSSEISEVHPGTFVSNAVINIINENNISEPMDSIPKSKIDRRYESIDVRKDDQQEKSKVRSLATKYDQGTQISRSHSEDNWGSKTLPYSKRQSEMSIPDLLADSSIWESDPDMHVAETFEANKELEYFKNHLKKDQNKGEYVRLLVLMEFHHKIKFTVMTLKRFDYLLIRKWPIGETFLLNTLRLNVIVPLYELIKTLDARIDLCKNETSYSKEMGRNVLDWLISDSESNLQQWLNYSIDLCCTNSLTSVKNAWYEAFRSDSRFSEVLNKRYNKIVMVEQLSNMRPLLFNLPLIVNKIMKDLSKFSVYKDEANIWTKIYEKFKRLPTFIDEHCMPLVQLINSGTIVNNVDRSTWISRLNPTDLGFDFILDFPKTAFHHKLFDFQEIIISNLKESYNKDKAPGVFIKDTVCYAYAICYDNMLVLLQKENERYHLKQFKAPDNSKLSPILMLNNVHATKGPNRVLTLVFLNIYVLAQLQFIKDDASTRWHDFISKSKSKVSFVSKPEIEMHSESVTDTVVVTSNEEFDKYADIKMKLEEFSSQHSSVFEEDINSEELNAKTVLFPITNDPKDVIIGTSFDAINMIKSCYENLSVPLSEDVLDKFLSTLSIMENRISNYKNFLSKDNLNHEDIECEISETQEGPNSVECLDEALNNSQSNSPNSETSDRNFDFLSLNNALAPSDSVVDSEKEDLSKEESFPAIAEFVEDETTLQFVSDYVSRILEHALKTIERDASEDREHDLPPSWSPPIDDALACQSEII